MSLLDFWSDVKRHGKSCDSYMMNLTMASDMKRFSSVLSNSDVRRLNFDLTRRYWKNVY